MRRLLNSLLLACCLVQRPGLCDGGAVMLVDRAEGRSWTLMMRPARPAVGPVEFDLIGNGSADARLALREADGPEEVLAFEPGPAPRVAHARTTLDREGSCVLRLLAPGSGAPAEIRFEVGPAAEPTLSRLPWILAWIPLCALLLLRAQALRSRNYTRDRA
jgi:hypothetical protein